MSKFGRKAVPPPPGFDYVEPVLTALENELREKVSESHEGLRKNESQWPIHQINWQRSRYIYDLYYTYGRISKEVYDYCIKNKLVDKNLMAYWKKPGYERLCSTYVINPKNYKYGTVSLCRVPRKEREGGEGSDRVIEDPVTGCVGCASGSNKNIFNNKYGQYLAMIQIAKEEKKKLKLLRKQIQEEEEARLREEEEQANQNPEVLDELPEDTTRGLKRKQEDSQDEDEEPESQQTTGKNKKKKTSPDLWVDKEAESGMELLPEMIGSSSKEAEREAKAAIQKQGK